MKFFDDIINKEPVDFIQELLPIYKGIEKVKKEIKEKSLIGFAGAPWTVLLYMLNKKSPKNNFNFNIINQNQNLIDKLLKKLEEIIDKILELNKKNVDQFKSGKHKLFGFFVGEVMKDSGGKANPQLVNNILKKKLK